MEAVFVSLGAGAPSGMLLKYDPASGRTTALMRGALWFANGVTLSQNEDFVLVADSIQAKVHRWVGNMLGRVVRHEGGDEDGAAGGGRGGRGCDWCLVARLAWGGAVGWAAGRGVSWGACTR